MGSRQPHTSRIKNKKLTCARPTFLIENFATRDLLKWDWFFEDLVVLESINCWNLPPWANLLIFYLWVSFLMKPDYLTFIKKILVIHYSMVEVYFLVNSLTIKWKRLPQKSRAKFVMETLSIFGDWRQDCFRAISSQILEWMYISPSSTYCENSATKAVLVKLLLWKQFNSIVGSWEFVRWRWNKQTFIYSVLLGLSEWKFGKSNTFIYTSSKWL